MLRSTAFHSLAKSSVALALLWALPAQADDDLRAVLQQVREQLKQDQLEIRALKGELAAVRKRLEQTPVAAAPGVPPLTPAMSL